MSYIKIINLNKRFKDYQAADNINLDIQSNEFVALLGPSGSGKTTLLRIIAGLEFPDSGSILLDGHEAHHQPITQRNVGFVFQHYALFKHMTVFENVAFGLRVRRKMLDLTEEQIIDKVTELLGLIHMEHLASRYPDQLSGGQRQRVALARVLAIKPKLLLLDEPFGALDAKVRKDLRRWIRELHDEIKLTSIFVTHDQEEAMEIADKVVLINEGKIEQQGTPQEVYDHPVNSFVYDFLGQYNVLQGWQDPNGDLYITLPPRAEQCKPVKIYVRPYDIQVVKSMPTIEHLPVQVAHINPWGPIVKMELENKADSSVIYAEVPRSVYDQLQLLKGDEVFIALQKKRVFTAPKNNY